MLAWLPPVAWAGIILFLSAQPARRLPDVGFRFSDKLVHAAVYAVLGALVARALARTRRPLTAVAAAVAVAVVAGFGLFDEWTQSFSPGRSPDLIDAVADAVGATAGFLLAMRYHRGRHAPHPPVRR